MVLKEKLPNTFSVKILFILSGSSGTGSFFLSQGVVKEMKTLGHTVKSFFPYCRCNRSHQKEYLNNPEEYELMEFPLRKKDVVLESFPLITEGAFPFAPKAKSFSKLSKEELELYLEELTKHLKKLIKEFQPDVIECQHLWLSAYVVNKLGFPFFCTAHHTDQLGFINESQIRPYVLTVTEKAKYIFTVSKLIENEVLNIYGNVDKKKVITIPPGFDKTIFYSQKVDKKALLKDLGLEIPKDSFIISFPGRISLLKGIDLVLKANALLQKEKNIYFLIFGSGDIDEVIPENEKNLCSYDRVFFLGPQSQNIMARVHNIADLCVLPSRSEGFGISLLEAMACGLPVISTNIVGSAEYLIGELVDNENYEQIAKAICEIQNLSKIEYQKLSQRAIDKASKFSYEKSAKKRLEYYSLL